MIKSAALLALAALASTASAETVTSTVFPGAQMTADLLFSGSKLVGYRATIPDFDALSYLPNAGMPVQRVKFPEHPQNPFNHLEVDFNPFGHPGGFTRDRMFEILATNQTLLTEESPYFLVPHFDFHFQIPTAEYVEGQMTCDTFPPCAGGNVALFHVPPPAGFIPDSFYYDVTADVPAMGAHWEDNNLAFTKENGLFLRQPALIYGSFNGELTFYENMASLECLRSVKNGTETVDFSFDTPRYFARAGNYPTRTRITYDSAASVYHIDFYNAEYECAGVDCAVANCGCKNVEATSTGKSVSIDFVDSSVASVPCQ